MDYSLLLGIHDVKKEILLILKTIISFEPKSFDKRALINTNPRDLDRQQDLPNDVFLVDLNMYFMVMMEGFVLLVKKISQHQRYIILVLLIV